MSNLTTQGINTLQPNPMPPGHLGVPVHPADAGNSSSRYPADFHKYKPDGTEKPDGWQDDDGATFSASQDASRDRRAAKSGAAAQQVGRPKPPVFTSNTPVGNSTVGATLSRFADAVWNVKQHPSPGATISENVRREAMDAVGGPTTVAGQELAQRLRAVQKYMNELNSAVTTYLRREPGFASIIRDAAESIRQTAVSSISNGLPIDNPAGSLQYNVQPRIASEANGARRAAEQAELRTREQIAGVRKFWHDEMGLTEDAIRFMTSGEVVFLSTEEMEKNCPGAKYVSYSNPFISAAVRGHLLEYGGGAVNDVFLSQDDGSERRVIFRGPTWMYADQEDLGDRAFADAALPASPHRHINPYWNPDPRVVNARSDYSSNARFTLVNPPPAPQG